MIIVHIANRVICTVAVERLLSEPEVSFLQGRKLLNGGGDRRSETGQCYS